MSIKGMIARCIKRMRSGACATCDNRHVCPAGQWQAALALPNRDEGDANAAPANRAGRALAFLAQVMSQRAQRAPCFKREVEDALVPLLTTKEATVEEVAQRLAISRQTLYRRLRAEGTTFQDLLAATRRRLAIRYLAQEKVPVKVAAWRLGFSSQAAFARAFKRWTGTSPGRFQSASAKL